MFRQGSLKWILSGTVSVILAIAMSIWTPLELFMEERIRMRPGLPAFEMWYHSPDVIRARFYLFNVTNGEKYLSGEDERLRVDEVGPFVFKEVWNISDVVFNDNGTMSYTVLKNLVWDPNLNEIDLNRTLVFPNLPILVAVSQYWNANYLLKLSMNILFEKLESEILVRKTIYEVLFRNTDPFQELLYSFLPSVAVVKNLGLVPLLYDGTADRINAFVGTRSGHQKFSLFDKINGTNHIPKRGATCKDTISDATDMMLYSQFVPKNRTIWYFKSQACKVAPLTYAEDAYRHGIKVYKFVAPEDVFNRSQPVEDDCYKGVPILPDGLMDMSACWHSFPMVGSFPHFLYGDGKIKNYVDGLRPNVTEHMSYVYIEPTTGLSMNSRAALQINLQMRPLVGFHEMFDRFSDTVIPIFRLSVGLDDLPNYLISLVKFVILLPTIGWFLTGVLYAFGLFSLWISLNEKVPSRRGTFQCKVGEEANVRTKVSNETSNTPI